MKISLYLLALLFAVACVVTHGEVKNNDGLVAKGVTESVEDGFIEVTESTLNEVTGSNKHKAIKKYKEHIASWQKKMVQLNQKLKKSE